MPSTQKKIAATVGRDCSCHSCQYMIGVATYYVSNITPQLREPSRREPPQQEPRQLREPQQQSLP